MRKDALKTATVAGERIVQGFSTSREAVAAAVQDGRKTVKQMVKRTRHAAEDLLDEATHNIKRFPIGSVAMAFGVGTVLGVLVMSRNGRK